MTPDPQIQAIRDALAQVKITPYGAAYPVSALDDLENACNPTAITALLARLDAAEADAARYLFLRHSDQWAFKTYPNSMVSTKWHSGHAPEEIDKAIDAARAQGGAG